MATLVNNPLEASDISTLHWTASTRYHDWFDKRRTIPRRMLSHAQQAGLIGKIDWIAVGPDDLRRKVVPHEKSLDELLDHQPRRGELYRIAAGGNAPFHWRMTMGLFPFDMTRTQVQGYNILNLWISQEPFNGSGGSDKIAQIFRKMHTAEDTEYAAVHPYQRWSELREVLNGAYGDPLTIGPMFQGVYWMNFLGRGHLEFFDLSRLRDVKAYQVEWLNDDTLFIRVCRDVADAARRGVEAEMFRLTDQFRAARR